MTRREKIAVSLPAELVAEARRAVEQGRAPSVSALVADALEEHLTADDLVTMLDEALARSGGPMTDDERAWADAILDG